MRYECGCDVGPGRFEGEGAETCILWEFSMDGGGDVHGPEGDSYDYFEGPVGEGSIPADMLEACKLAGYCEACAADAWARLTEAKGACVGQTAQGFIWSTIADDESEHARMLQAIAEDDADAEDAEGEED